MPFGFCALRITAFIPYFYLFFRMNDVRGNWKDYNEQLVRSGKILLDLNFLRSWNKELEEMNRDKLGRPYEYSATYIRFLSMIYCLSLSCTFSICSIGITRCDLPNAQLT